VSTPTVRTALERLVELNKRSKVVLSIPSVNWVDAEALAARPLLERVAAMADRIGIHTVGEITAISDRAAAWLRDNPLGQPVAIEPRGCLTPGACSCVGPTPPAPEPEEVGELVGQLMAVCATRGFDGWRCNAVRRAVTLLQWQAAELAALRGVPAAELDDQRREAVYQAIAEALGSGAYDCLRVWSAWSYGTMGPDDFVPVAENTDRVAEIADAAIEAIRAISLPASAPVSEYPHCGYEGEMVPAPQAGEAEADELHLREELDPADRLLENREQVLRAIPECPIHGPSCVPHAMEWIERAKTGEAKV
jgi:hypothetical protein